MKGLRIVSLDLYSILQSREVSQQLVIRFVEVQSILGSKANDIRSLLCINDVVCQSVLNFWILKVVARLVKWKTRVDQVESEQSSVQLFEKLKVSYSDVLIGWINASRETVGNAVERLDGGYVISIIASLENVGLLVRVGIRQFCLRVSWFNGLVCLKVSSGHNGCFRHTANSIDSQCWDGRLFCEQSLMLVSCDCWEKSFGRYLQLELDYYQRSRP